MEERIFPFRPCLFVCIVFIGVYWRFGYQITQMEIAVSSLTSNLIHKENKRQHSMLKILPFSANTQPSAIYRMSVHLLRNSNMRELPLPHS